jgi:hypothetical protein
MNTLQEIIAWIIAIAIIVAFFAVGGFLYWFFTKKVIRLNALLFKGRTFKKDAENEGVKQTVEEKEYLRNYLKQMAICGAVFAAIVLFIMIKATDFTYYKIYPIKTLITDSYLRDSSNIILLVLGPVIGFMSGFALYPYKLFVFMIFPFGGKMFGSIDDYDD